MAKRRDLDRTWRILTAASLWLALLGTASLSAQALSLEASPNPALVYQKVSLSVVVPTQDPETVSAHFQELGGAVHLVSGPYIQPYVSEASPAVPEVRVSYVIEGNEPGRVVIPPLELSVGGSRRTTAPFVMSFGVLHAGEVVVPLRPVWELPGNRPGSVFFAGEVIPVLLVLRNELAPRQGVQVAIASPMPALMEVQEPAQATRTLVGRTALYQVPVASYLLTAVEAGTVTLPSATVSVGGRTGVSAPAQVRISPPPEAIAATGAIGALSFRSWTTSRRVEGGEEIFLHLRVEGSGNLPILSLPRPSSRGLLELGSDETRSLTAGSGGYRGFRERIYRFLRPAGSDSAAGTISVPRFVWLDPRSRRVDSVPPSTYSFVSHSRPRGAAEAAAGPAGGPAPPGRAASLGQQVQPASIPFAPESARAVRRSEYRELYTRGETYLWLLPGPLIFGLFLLVRPRKRKWGGGLGAAALSVLLLSCRLAPIHNMVTAGIAAYEQGKLEQAGRDFAAARSSYPRNPALSFDRALVEYRLGRYGAAIHLVRNAIYYDPLSVKYRAALDWMVSQIDVPEQVPPAYPVPPDLFLFLLIAVVNAASILGILVMLRGRGGLAIALILCLALTLIAGGGLAYSAAKRSVENAVVKSSGTEMTKIPMAAAARWLELPAGMAVRILDRADGYYLVQTAYGNTGWVHQGSVLLDDR